MYRVCYHQDRSQCRGFYNSTLFLRPCHVDRRLLRPRKWFFKISDLHRICAYPVHMITCLNSKFFSFGRTYILWVCGMGWQVLAHTAPSTHSVYPGADCCPPWKGVYLCWQSATVQPKPSEEYASFFLICEPCLVWEPWTAPEANLGCRQRETTPHCSMPARMCGSAVPGVINLDCLLDKVKNHLDEWSSPLCVCEVSRSD